MWVQLNERYVKMCFTRAHSNVFIKLFYQSHNKFENFQRLIANYTNTLQRIIEFNKKQTIHFFILVRTIFIDLIKQ